MDDPTDPRITLTLKLSQLQPIILALKMLIKFAGNNGHVPEAYLVDDVMREVQRAMDNAVRGAH